MGCLFPKADNVSAYWSNIRDGVDAITEIPADTHWNPADYFDDDKTAPDMTYAKTGGFINKQSFDPLHYGISPNNIQATDTTQLLGMMACEQALLDAGYCTDKSGKDGREFNRDRTSVIMGVTGTLELVIPLGARLSHPLWKKALADAGVDDETAKDVVARISEGYVPWQENSFPGLLGNVAAGRIANRFDLGGTNCVVDAACASSLSAMHMGVMELYTNRADMVITGGLDTFNDIFMFMCFSKTPAMSPSGHAKPFAKLADGTILGEGLGITVIKRLEDAERDGDQIYAVLNAIGTSSDGRGNAIYAPSDNGQAKCLRDAYEQAGVTPRDIDLVEAHGTGTKAGDATEIKAITEVYSQASDEDSWAAIGSVKSMIGHTKAAAGSAGFIKAAMALHHKVLPPTIKVDEPAEILKPYTSPFYVNTVKRPWVSRMDGKPRRAALSAFGFGGSNYHAVLQEYPQAAKPIDWDGNVQLIAISGVDANAITKQLDALDSKADWNTLRTTAAESRKTFDGKANARLIIVIQQGQTDLAKLINTAKTQLATGKTHWQTPDGAFFGSAKHNGKLAVLFPGQGAQYTGMLRDLACQFPQMLNALDLGNITFGQTKPNGKLSDLVYPIPVFTDEEQAAQTAKLGDTRNTQPALGAVSLGAWQVLQHFGIAADFTAGHSFGELVALHAAGRITASDLMKLALVRGQLMSQTSESESGASGGAMMAVMLDKASVEAFLADNKLDGLIVANHNSPQQVVLSGPVDQIDEAQKLFKTQKTRCKKLAVSSAFHSSFVSDAAKPFAQALAEVDFASTNVKVFANTTAQAYPDDVNTCRDLLANQLAKPVRFVEQVENLHQAGVRTFIEVGPNRHLAGMVSSILDGKEHTLFTLDNSTGRKSGQLDLALLLAGIASCGHEVQLTAWDSQWLDDLAKQPKRKKGFTVPVCGANAKPKPSNRKPVAPKPRVQPAAAPTQSANAAPTQNTEKQALSQPLNTTRSNNVTQQPQPQNGQAVPANMQAMAFAQQSILALQQLQQQTAALHHQYLLGQEANQRTIETLINQQMMLMSQPGAQLPAIPMPTMSQQPVQSVPMPTFTPPVQPQPVYQQPVAPQPVAQPIAPQATPTPVPQAAAPAPAPAPVAQPATPAPAPTTPAASTSSSSKASDVLLEVVAEKTGYPTEMLDLSMSLDEDLGIDSIKRVEILSSLQEKMPEAPAIKPDDLSSLHTLQQIVDFLDANMSPASAPAAAVIDSPATGALSGVSEVLLEVIAEKTGYPTEMLELSMSLDEDLGIDSIKRVEILSSLQEKMPEAPPIKPDDLSSLQTLQQIVDFLEKNGPFVTAPSQQLIDADAVMALNQSVETSNIPFDFKLDRHILVTAELDASSQTPITLPAGQTVVIADDGTDLPQQLAMQFAEQSLQSAIVGPHDELPDPTTVCGLVLMLPDSADTQAVIDAFTLLQQLGPALKASIKQHGVALLACITRLDGKLGLGGSAINAPMTASLAGMIKTASHEWPQVTCRVIDIDDNATPETIANQLLHTGPMEVGIAGDDLIQTQLLAESIDNKLSEKLPIKAQDTVIVTGGARGVTAEVATAIARIYKCRLLLVGRSPIPESEPAWLRDLQSEADIKKAIVANATTRLMPRDVQVRYQKVIANRQIVETLGRIEQAGGKATYATADVRNAKAIEEILDAARTRGPVAGIIHGAGVLADRHIEDKTTEQFDMVFGTKVEGFNNLMRAANRDELKVIINFSSSTGRFGRKGQIDYAAANDTLNKHAQQQKSLRPDCRVLSINWGPWDGGMVNDDLKKLFASEGIQVIPMTDGANYLAREIDTPTQGPVEIVILGQGSDLSLSMPKLSTAQSQAVQTTSKPMMSLPPLAFDRVVSVDQLPILKDHVMNAKAVLPAALMMEYLGAAAIAENPGLNMVGIENFTVFKGIIVDANEKLTLHVHAGYAENTGDFDKVITEIRSGENSKTLHARATILMGQLSSAPTASDLSRPQMPYPLTGDKIYTTPGLLFHGEQLHAIAGVEACDDMGISGRLNSAPSPSQWITKPTRTTWLTDPLLIDGVFQMMILWTQQKLDQPSLPTKIEHYQQFAERLPSSGVQCVCRIIKQTAHEITVNVELLDGFGSVVALMSGYHCVVDASLRDAFLDNQLGQKVQA
jgi:acyl transferase domain-containing protein